MAEGWSWLLAGIAAQSMEFAEGEALFAARDETRFLFHVNRGQIRLSRHGVCLHRAGPGSLVAETSLFAATHDCDAVADKPSRVDAFPKSEVLLHLSAHPQISMAFSAHLARQAMIARGLLEVIRLKSARERVIAYLTVKGAVDGEVTLDQSLMAVAGRIGLTHEAFYRTLKLLETEGRLIRRGKRSFRLVS